MKTELTYKDIPKSFENWFKKTFDDIDKIDVFSEYDRAISVGENQQLFIEKFSNLLSEEYKDKESAEAMKIQEEKTKVETQERIEKEEQELIDEWKNKKAENIEVSEFDTAKHLILLTTRGFSYATILTGEGGIGKCIHFSNRSDFVLSNDGKMLHIKDMPTEIVTLNQETYRLQNSKVNGITKRKVNEIYRVTTKTGRKIEPTKEHPFLTINGWKPITELKEGDYIATPRRYDLNLKKEIDLDYVKILAYLLAEGHLGNTITFSNGDIKLISELKESIEKIYSTLTLKKLKCGQYEYIISKIDISKRKENPLITEMDRLGLRHKKSGDKFIPNEIIDLSNNQIAIFLNRFFSCDGWAYKGQIAITLKSETIIRQIQHLLLRFGILSIIKKTYKCATNTKEKRKQLYWNLYITDNESKKTFKDKIGFFLERKQNKIEISEKQNTNIDIIPLSAKKGTHTLHQTRATTENKVLANSDVFWDKIETIEKLKGEFVVYDIGVDKTHNFICNDIIAHNTFLTINTIKQETKDFVYKCGYTTPMSLYQFLYQNKDKLIVLDDIEGIFKDNIALSILKGALWDTDGKRLVQYDTTSKKISAPSCFEFTGRLIVLCNKIQNDTDVSVKAMLSRTNHYKINFTYHQKLKMIKMILNKHKDISKEQKALVLKILKKNTDVATENFNFRTLEKLISLVKYNEKKAEELFVKTIDINSFQKIVWELMNSGKSMNEQVSSFFERTGKHRSTFYEVKREVKLKMGKDKIEYIEVR